MDICEKIYTIFGRSIKSKLNRRRGFAIVEIIVVVVIISALFTVLVKSLGSAAQRAESGPGRHESGKTPSYIREKLRS